MCPLNTHFILLYISALNKSSSTTGANITDETIVTAIFCLYTVCIPSNPGSADASIPAAHVAAAPIIAPAANGIIKSLTASFFHSNTNLSMHSLCSIKISTGIIIICPASPAVTELLSVLPVTYGTIAVTIRYIIYGNNASHTQTVFFLLLSHMSFIILPVTLTVNRAELPLFLFLYLCGSAHQNIRRACQ